MTEYFQQGNQFVCENVVSICDSKAEEFTGIWTGDLKLEEHELFKLCLKRVLLPNENVDALCAIEDAGLRSSLVSLRYIMIQNQESEGW